MRLGSILANPAFQSNERMELVRLACSDAPVNSAPAGEPVNAQKRFVNYVQKVLKPFSNRGSRWLHLVLGKGLLADIELR